MEMTMLKLLTLTPIGLAAAVLASGEIPGIPVYVQYGALGMCAAVVAFLCRFLQQREKAHSEERDRRWESHMTERAELVRSLAENQQRHEDKIEKITERVSKSLDRFTDILETRPCIGKPKQ